MIRHTNPVRRVAFACIFALSMLAHAQDDALRQLLERTQYEPNLFIADEPLYQGSALLHLYEQRGFKFIWLDASGRPLPLATTLVKTLARSAEHGLVAADYHTDVLTRSLNTDTAALGHAELDLLLSDALLTYASHLKSGKVDPSYLAEEWQPRAIKPSGQSLLAELGRYDAATFQQALDALAPPQPRYRRLKQRLLALREQDAPEWSELPSQPVIKPEQSDARVPSIRERLRFWGDLSPDTANEDMRYDAITVAAVQQFQRRHGLDTDGVIGAETLRALNVSPAKRAEQIAVNMERWRWLDDTFDSRFLVVNIAGFDLRIYEGPDVALQMPVIVGREYRRTPVFSDRMRYLVLNPTWTVPYKLATQDKLPEIQRDPEYLARLGFSVYDTHGSTALDPASINWSALSRRHFPYRLVQAPGPQNALGRIKFMFPNKHNVYLHDTPSRELFLKSERAFSSGCIRVAEPVQLAEYLLKDQGWNVASIEAALAKGETRTVNLSAPMQIHIEYWTAWISRDGELNFRKDIYKRDAPLHSALSAPLATGQAEPSGEKQ